MQQLLKLPEAAYAPGGKNVAAPAIGQALGLSHRGEQLGVEEFIPEQLLNHSAKPFRHGEPGSM